MIAPFFFSFCTACKRFAPTMMKRRTRRTQVQSYSIRNYASAKRVWKLATCVTHVVVTQWCDFITSRMQSLPTLKREVWKKKKKAPSEHRTRVLSKRKHYRDAMEAVARHLHNYLYINVQICINLHSWTRFLLEEIGFIIIIIFIPLIPLFFLAISYMQWW